MVRFLLIFFTILFSALGFSAQDNQAQQQAQQPMQMQDSQDKSKSANTMAIFGKIMASAQCALLMKKADDAMKQGDNNAAMMYMMMAKDQCNQKDENEKAGQGNNDRGEQVASTSDMPQNYKMPESELPKTEPVSEEIRNRSPYFVSDEEPAPKKESVALLPAQEMITDTTGTKPLTPMSETKLDGKELGLGDASDISSGSSYGNTHPKGPQGELLSNDQAKRLAETYPSSYRPANSKIEEVAGGGSGGSENNLNSLLNQFLGEGAQTGGMPLDTLYLPEVATAEDPKLNIFERATLRHLKAYHDEKRVGHSQKPSLVSLNK